MKEIYPNIKNGHPKPWHKKPTRAGYFGSIIFNIIFLYIFNNLLNWHTPYLTIGFTAALWAINLSIVASIIGNLIFIIYDKWPIKNIIQIIMNIFSFIAAYVVFMIFPFAFNHTWDLVAKVILIIAMVALVIATIVQIFKLFTRKE